MNKLNEKPLSEITFKWYEYYPGDCVNDHYPVLCAFVPDDIMDSYQEHCVEDEDLALDYLNEQLGEYGYSDDEIFFYFREGDYASEIHDTPHGADVLIEEDDNGL